MTTFEDFITWKENNIDRQLSHKTKTHYRQVVGLFERWIDDCGVPGIEYITKDIVRDYLKTKECLASYTQRDYKAILKCFFDYCVDARIIKETPMKTTKLTMPKQRNKPAYPLPELRKTFLAACATDRERLLVTVFSFTGCRMGEIVRLNWNENINIAKKVLVVAGKTGRREVPISEAFKSSLQFYRNGSPYFFPKKHDHLKPYSQQSLYGMFRTIASTAGMPQVTSHSFRRSVATHLLRRCKDPKTVATILGMTVKVLLEHYIDADLEWQREVVELL